MQLGSRVRVSDSRARITEEPASVRGIWHLANIDGKLGSEILFVLVGMNESSQSKLLRRNQKSKVMESLITIC